MQSSFLEYYNSFYKQMALIDRSSNDYSKIEGILPEFSSGAKVLDVASGYGSVSVHLNNNGYDVTALEVNSDALRHLKSIGICALEMDISQGIILDDKYDIILLLDILEHIFDPITVLLSCTKILTTNGYIIVTVPLYFDILDRLKVLFTGSVVSIDNYCYGEKLYDRIKSYNYDHIRFFRPKEIFEIINGCNLSVDKYYFTKGIYNGPNHIFRILSKVISNKYTLRLFPNLIAHRMTLRLKLK